MRVAVQPMHENDVDERISCGVDFGEAILDDLLPARSAHRLKIASADETKRSGRVRRTMDLKIKQPGINTMAQQEQW